MAVQSDGNSQFTTPLGEQTRALINIQAETIGCPIEPRLHNCIECNSWNRVNVPSSAYPDDYRYTSFCCPRVDSREATDVFLAMFPVLYVPALSFHNLQNSMQVIETLVLACAFALTLVWCEVDHSQPLPCPAKPEENTIQVSFPFNPRAMDLIKDPSPGIRPHVGVCQPASIPSSQPYWFDLRIL